MSTTPEKPSASAAVYRSGVSAQIGGPVLMNLVVMALLVVGLSLFLLPQWRHNPDLPHGWFTPFIFLLLVHEARTRGTQRFLPAGKFHFVAVAVCVGSALVLLTLGGLYMAVLEWTHALVALMVTGALCTFLTAVWLTAASERVRGVPFNWPAGVAIFLWLLSTPLPPGTYATLTQTLQTGVTRTVLGLLHFFGVAAVRHGNILVLTDVAVGVEEACSGVRSLLSCIYTGFFLSATLVRRPWSRVWIVLLAGPLAIVMNVVRSFTLTVLAHSGVEINGLWHDATGYAVLGVTAVLLAWLAVALERRNADVSEKSRQASAESLAVATASAGLEHGAQRLVTVGLWLALAITGVILFNLRPARISGRTPPDLTALLPATYAGWEAAPSKDLYRFSAQLQTTHLAQTTYKRLAYDGGQPIELTVYLAYWPAGLAPVSVVATHTPDACWPGSGWIMQATPTQDQSEKIALAKHPFDEAEQRVFGYRDWLQVYGAPVQHVWYWHLYDGRVIHPQDVRSPRRLLLLAWRYGFQREGEQLFVRVSSNRPLEQIANEPILEEIFTRLSPFGL